jgi:hypothetical protein
MGRGRLVRREEGGGELTSGESEECCCAAADGDAGDGEGGDVAVAGDEPGGMTAVMVPGRVWGSSLVEYKVAGM